MKEKEKLITVIIPIDIYDALQLNRKKKGISIQFQVNEALRLSLLEKKARG